MAVTKIKAIRSTVDSAIAYIINPAKTDEKLLVSSFGCSIETAAKEFEWTRKTAMQHGMPDTKILARHVIQSFDVGEVTPELAHEIGRQFADEMLGGKYEYVLATHVDKKFIIILFSMRSALWITMPIKATRKFTMICGI